MFLLANGHLACCSCRLLFGEVLVLQRSHVMCSSKVFAEALGMVRMMMVEDACGCGRQVVSAACGTNRRQVLYTQSCAIFLSRLPDTF